MSRVKVVKAKQNKELAELFGQMLGAGNVNIEVCYPKYALQRKHLLALARVGRLLAQVPTIVHHAEFAACREQIITHSANVEEHVAAKYTITIDDPKQMTPEQKERFTSEYEETKNDRYIVCYIAMCNELVVYRKYIADPDNVDAGFIKRMPGSDFSPLQFTNLNLKRLFVVAEADCANDENRNTLAGFERYVMLVLSKFYVISHALYKVYSSPDVDVEEFSRVVMNSLNEAKKRIPRCEKAFDKIKQSIDLLKTNFPTYYRDAVATKNNNNIMENFIIDVVASTNADAETTRQFKTIMSYYRKVAAEQGNNPKLKALFEKVNDSFAALDSRTSNLSDDNDDEDSSDDSGGMTDENRKVAAAFAEE